MKRLILIALAFCTSVWLIVFWLLATGGM